MCVYSPLVHRYMYVHNSGTCVQSVCICTYVCVCQYVTVLEDEYQACAQKREEKENILNDARAELEALIADVERYTEQLSRLKREEDKAKDISVSHPDTVSQLRERVESALCVLTPQHDNNPCSQPEPESTSEKKEEAGTNAIATTDGSILDSRQAISVVDTSDTIINAGSGDIIPAIVKVEEEAMDTSTCASLL